MTDSLDAANKVSEEFFAFLNSIEFFTAVAVSCLVLILLGVFACIGLSLLLCLVALV